MHPLVAAAALPPTGNTTSPKRVLFPVTQSPPVTPGREVALAVAAASPPCDPPDIVTSPVGTSPIREGLVLTPQQSPPAAVNQVEPQNFVLGLNLSKCPENAAKAFDPKTQEFFKCCDYVHAGDMKKCHLTHEKVHRFVFHQCFRERKKKGGKKGERVGSGSFNKTECNRPMKGFLDGTAPGMMNHE